MADTFHCVHVQIRIKPGAASLQAFRTATLANAGASVNEPGILRFDVFEDQDNPTRFVLIGIYRSPEAQAAHRATAHYQAWRAAVDDLMAEARTARRFNPLFPASVDDVW